MDFIWISFCTEKGGAFFPSLKSYATWQGAGIRWSIRSLPTQIILSFYNNTKKKKKNQPSTWSFDTYSLSFKPDLFVKTSNKHESDSQPNMLESKAIIDFAILINGGPSPVIDYGVSL